MVIRNTLAIAKKALLPTFRESCQINSWILRKGEDQSYCYLSK